MIVLPVKSTVTVRFTIDRALALSLPSIIDPSIRCKTAGLEGPLTIHQDVCCGSIVRVLPTAATGSLPSEAVSLSG